MLLLLLFGLDTIRYLLQQLLLVLLKKASLKTANC